MNMTCFLSPCIWEDYRTHGIIIFKTLIMHKNYLSITMWTYVWAETCTCFHSLHVNTSPGCDYGNSGCIWDNTLLRLSSLYHVYLQQVVLNILIRMWARKSTESYPLRIRCVSTSTFFSLFHHPVCTNSQTMLVTYPLIRALELTVQVYVYAGKTC